MSDEFSEAAGNFLKRWFSEKMIMEFDQATAFLDTHLKRHLTRDLANRLTTLRWIERESR